MESAVAGAVRCLPGPFAFQNKNKNKTWTVEYSRGVPRC